MPEDVPLYGFTASKHHAVHQPIRKLGSWGVNYLADAAPKVGENAFKGQHFIAFDGERWRVGYGGGPNSFLDAEKYPAHIYSCEGIGNKVVGAAPTGTYHRSCHTLHGYTSKDATFPKQIPHLDKAQLAALHEEHVIPHWFYQHEDGKAPPVKVRTSYQPHTELSHVALRDYLPKEAVDKLRKAHTAGKPIMLAYDEATKTVTDVTEHYRIQLEKAENAAAAKAGAQSVTRTPTKPNGGTSATSLTGATEEISKKSYLSFTNEAGHIRWGKVTGVGAGIAITGLAAYLLLCKKEPKKGWAERSERHDNTSAAAR